MGMIRPLYIDTPAAAELFFLREKGADRLAQYLSNIKSDRFM